MTIDLKTLAAAVADSEKDLATYPMEGFPTEEAQTRALIEAGRAYPTLMEALRKAAEQFRFYEREHDAKANGEPDSYVSGDRRNKAARNREFAEMCEAAIASSGGQEQAPLAEDAEFERRRPPRDPIELEKLARAHFDRMGTKEEHPWSGVVVDVLLAFADVNRRIVALESKEGR